MKINFLFFIIFITIFLFSGLFRIYTYASEDLVLDIFRQVDSDITLLNNFVEDIKNVNKDSILNFREGTLDLIHKLKNSINYYQKKESEATDNKLKEIIINIKNNILNISEDLNSIINAIDNNDFELLKESLNNYDSHISILNNSVKELNNYSGVFDYIPILGWCFWLSLIISLVLFFLSRGNPLLPAEKLRKEFEKALFKSSLWPLFGSGISYFWGLNTKPGEKYYIFWGLIIIGYYQFLKGLYYYFRYARPSINLAKQKQQEKLDKLLSSDDFQKESLKEQLEDIKKLKPIIKT